MGAGRVARVDGVNFLARKAVSEQSSLLPPIGVEGRIGRALNPSGGVPHRSRRDVSKANGPFRKMFLPTIRLLRSLIPEYRLGRGVPGPDYGGVVLALLHSPTLGWIRWRGYASIRGPTDSINSDSSVVLQVSGGPEKR